MTITTMQNVKTIENAIQMANSIAKKYLKSSGVISSDDLGQDASLKVWQRWADFDQSQDLKNWVFTIVHQCFVDMVRKAKAAKRDSERTISIHAEDANGDTMDVQQCFRTAYANDYWNGTPPQIAIAREDRQRVENAINRLSDSERYAVKQRRAGNGLDAANGMRAKRAIETLNKIFGN